MDGIQAQRRPIIRDDGIAYVWSVKNPKDSWVHNTCIRTDETTDVHSVIGYQANAELVVEYLSESRWTELVKMAQSLQTNKYQLLEISAPSCQTKMAKPPENEESEKRVEKNQTRNQHLFPKKMHHFSIDLRELQLVTNIRSMCPCLLKMTMKMIDSIQEDFGPGWFKLTIIGELLGIPTSEDVGTNECKVRIVDNEGLSSDAILVVEVKEKVLNRAPYWNPNVKISTEVDTTKKEPIKKDLKAKETVEKKESSPKSRSRRRRR